MAREVLRQHGNEHEQALAHEHAPAPRFDVANRWPGKRPALPDAAPSEQELRTYEAARLREALIVPVAKLETKLTKHEEPPPPPAPRPRAPAGKPKPPAPVAIPPELRSGNQAAVATFVAEQRAKRDAAREQIKHRQLAQCVQASVDGNAIAIQTKAKNDQKLAALRQDAARKKAAAAQRATAPAAAGPVTVASLQQKLETDVAADKQRLAETFDGKQAELKARLETMRETLAAETQKQIANLEAQQKAREGEAKQAWLAQQANLRKANEELVAKVRASVQADQAKLAAQEQQLAQATEQRIAQLEADGKRKAAAILVDGETKARAAFAAAKEAGVEDKGRQSADAITAEARAQSKKVTAETAKAVEDAKLKAKGQLAAIGAKVDQLNALGAQKLRQADEALQKKLAAGEQQLAKKLAGNQVQIEKLRADGDAKVGKLEADAAKKLRAEYDRRLAAIDQRAAAARKALAAGSEKNVAALQRMVEQTCKAIDEHVAAAEQRMDGHVAAAEQHAQAAVIAQLHRIKAEADAALRDIDKWFEQAMAAVDDAVAAAHRQLEETAQGKLLEIEVHVATMFKDTGDSTRHDAVKKQLAWYIENKQPIPPGFGEVAAPEQKQAPGAAAAAAAGKPPAATDPAKQPDAAKRDEDPAAKLLDPENLSPEGIEAKVAEQLKRGQKDTAAGGAAAAEERVQHAYAAASKAVGEVAGKQTAELEKLKSGDPDAVAALANYRHDVAVGEAAAEKIAAPDPDKRAIMRALEGKTPDQIAAMRSALAAKGIDLDQLVDGAFSGDEKQEAKIRLQGNPIAADVAALNLNGVSKTGLLWGGDLALAYTAATGEQARMREILARYQDPKDLAEFAKQFEAQTGRPLSQYLAMNGMSGDAKALGVPERPRDQGTSEEIKARAADEAKRLAAEATRGGRAFNGAGADASIANLAEALRGAHFPSTRGDMVRDQLAGKSPEELAYIRAKYKAETGRDLDRDMENSLPEESLAEAKATLRSDKQQAAVAKILGAESASFTPWTVDDKQLHDALKELKDPAERRAVLEAYKQRTGTDLADVIAEKMTGNDKDIALAYYEGDALKARMIELDEATNGGWMNSMHRAVEERTGLPTQRFTRAMVNSLITPVGAAVSLFAPDDASIVVGGYELQSGAIHKVDADKIFEILEETSNPEDRARLAAMYEQRTGRSLDADMGSKLATNIAGARGDQSNVDAYRALMEGRTHDYRAARMDAALAGVNDPAAFHKMLEGKNAQERAAIIEAFNKRHGGGSDAFQKIVAQQLSGMDVEKANLLATTPDDPKTGVVKLPDAFVLRYAQDSIWNTLAKTIDSSTGFLDKYPFLYAVPVFGLAAAQAKVWGYFMRGWGVDGAAIKGVLHGKSKAEIEELKKQYPQLEADLKYCLSGRDAFEVELQLAEGEPQTPEAKIRRALALHRFDRGDGSWHAELSNHIVDALSPSGGMMDRKADALREQLAALRASGGKLTPEQQREIDSSLAMLDASTDGYLAAREEITASLASAVGAVAGAVVTALTGGAAAPLLAALASGLMTAGVKAVMLGGAYGRNELGVDMAMMAVQMATAGLAPEARSFLAQVISGGIENAASSFVSTATTSADAHNLLSILSAASRSGLVGFFSGAAGAVAQQALGDAMEALAPKAFGRDASLAAVFAKGFVSGGGSSVASMLVEAMANPEMLAGDWDAVLGQILKTFAEGGFQNAVGDVGGELGQRREQARHEQRAHDDEHGPTSPELSPHHDEDSAPIVDIDGKTVPPLGLASPIAIESFVGRMQEVQGEWFLMTKDDRVRALSAALNAELAARGLPPVTLKDAPLSDHARGQFDHRTSEIHINEKLLQGTAISSDDMAQLARTIWHEARHSEQTYLMARHLERQGLDVTEIARLMFRSPARVQELLDAPMPVTAHQLAEGRKYFNSIYNKDASTNDGLYQHRRDVMRRAKEGDPAAYQEYRRLVEEADAFAVGDEMEAAYRAAHERALAEELAALADDAPDSEPLHVHDSELEDIPDSEPLRVHDSELEDISVARLAAPIVDINGNTVQPTGLADPVAIHSFVGRMSDIEARWSSLDVGARVAALTAAINAELDAKRIPRVRIDALPLAGNHGFHEYSTGSIKLDFDLVRGSKIHPAQMALLTNTIWHEARHAEQWHLIVRYLATRGHSVDEIASITYIHPHLVHASLADREMLTPQQFADGKKYYANILGEGRAHRDRVMEARSRDPVAYAHYLRLVEEADAHAVGYAVQAAYEGRHLVSSEHEPPDLEQRELDRIRNGPAGRIRGEAELSDADVVRSLNAQLKAIEREQVEAMIGKFPAHLQAEARIVLAESSGFGNMESLNVLRVAMQPYLVGGSRLYTPGNSSLADNMAYLARKDTYAHVPGADHRKIKPTPDLTRGAIVILDAVILHQIRHDPEFAQRLVDHRCVLLDPHGYNAGINMFNAPSPEMIERRTGELLARAREIHAASGGALRFEDAVRTALGEGTAKTLGDAHPELVKMLVTVDARRHGDRSSETIARQINGDAGMSEADLSRALQHLSPEERDLARELLARHSEISSSRGFALALADHHQKLVAQMIQRGLDPQKVYFYVPEIAKSYGMVAMAHREATGTSPDRYLSGIDDLEARALSDDAVVVILDDVAGSGESLQFAFDTIGGTPFRGHVVVAPMLATEVAAQLFAREVLPGRTDVSFEPHAAIRVLQQSAFYRGLDPVQQSRLLQLIGDPGYNDNALCMAFPYMAPDNNNRFFADLIARHFIVNKNQLGSKNRSDHTSTPP